MMRVSNLKLDRHPHGVEIPSIEHITAFDIIRLLVQADDCFYDLLVPGCYYCRKY